MAHVECEEVDNWFDLSLRIDDYFTHFNNYIFRGHAESDWKLEPTLTRALNKFYPREADRRQIHDQHLQYFKENIRGRCSLDLSSCKEEELWALGQHFGLHTPLLDWTHSPYVAVFFSLVGESSSGKRALWALLEGDISAINKGRERLSQLKIVSPLSHHNPRLVTQRGLFLEVPLGTSVEDLVKSAQEEQWITMYKITYPDAIRNDALSALNNMNINYASLFPDLAGASLNTNYLLEAEPYLDAQRERAFSGARSTSSSASPEDR